jgi:DNA (cytosine-5)-methyltransferase 1
MKLLDLFSGIGGFSYGLENLGFKTVAFCEMDKYCKLVLQKHWKGVKIYNDVKEITKERLKADGVEAPDIITGGFPCQPFSVAGKQKGTSDDRYLWPEMFRIIKELKPRWVIGENVKGLVNLQNGLVFETVCTDLEGEGYEVRAFNIPAAGVGAPHRRERIWIVAYAKRYNKTDEIRGSNEEERRIQKEHRQDNSSSRLTSGTSSIRQSNNGYEDVENSRRTLRQGTELREKNEDETRKENADQHQRSNSPSKSNVANTESIESYVGKHRKHQTEGNGQSETRGKSSEDVADTHTRLSDGTYEEVQSRGQTFDTSSEGSTDVANANSERQQEQCRTESVQKEGNEPQRSSSQARHAGWESEPDVGRVANGIPGRVHRLKALGNSIVPQIAEEIGKAIMKAENEVE